jgi:predicted ATPase
LRNLHDKRVIDERYDTIISFMQESFPAFDNLFFEQTGRYTVYGNFLEKGRRKPIRSSGVSDGHLQMLINLTALFSEGQNRYSLILFDEPEISLHPWALAVFAKAVKLATKKWDKLFCIKTGIIINQKLQRSQKYASKKSSKFRASQKASTILKTRKKWRN